MARPIEFTNDVITRAEKYLVSCVDEIEEYHKTRGSKSDTFERIVRVKIPTIEGLAAYLDIARSTLYEWEKKYQGFSDIIDKLQVIQADRLINNGMSGDYNPTIAKVVLSKHGYREAVDTEHKGNLGLNIAPISDARFEAIIKTYASKRNRKGSDAQGDI